MRKFLIIMLMIAATPVALSQATSEFNSAQPSVAPQSAAAQNGRVELAPIPVEREIALRSLRSATPTQIEFLNHSRQEIRIYWLNYQGQRQAYGSLQPGGVLRQGTFLSHPWVVTDVRDQALGLYLPSAWPSSVTVSDTIVELPALPCGRELMSAPVSAETTVHNVNLTSRPVTVWTVKSDGTRLGVGLEPGRNIAIGGSQAVYKTVTNAVGQCLGNYLPNAGAGRIRVREQDYDRLVWRLSSIEVEKGAAPGSIAVFGRAAFPILVEEKHHRVLMAAGFFGDDPDGARFSGDNPIVARAVALSHFPSVLQPVATRQSLLYNASRWAGKKAEPVIGLTEGLSDGDFPGFKTKAVDDAAADLSGVDVLAFNAHNAYTKEGRERIAKFAASGGGLLVFGVPWNLGDNLKPVNELLNSFGLSYREGSIDQKTFAIPAQPHSIYHSALNAAEALIREARGQMALGLDDKRIAGAAIDGALAAGVDAPGLATQLASLSDAYGVIAVTEAEPLKKAEKPVEAMLARYQSSRWDTLPASELVEHPSAKDWPGLPAAGPAVTRTTRVNGDAPKNVLINQGARGVRVFTGLYAVPGKAVTVTIPADKVNAKLDVQIGIHEAENWDEDVWPRYPKVIRRDHLTAQSTQTGCVFGGLIFIWVPAGAMLGTFPVTISGAVEAPYFKYGVTSEAEWNASIKSKPGAWGVMETAEKVSKGKEVTRYASMTLFVSRQNLMKVSNPNQVMAHWERVIATADEYMGYSDRRRGEAAVTDRYLFDGVAGHEGYPVIMYYGDSDTLVKGVLEKGDWGFYHELGHTYQRSFDSAYNIGTHGEVEVNLVPGLLLAKVHGQTAWDVPNDRPADAHFYGAVNRLKIRNAFLNLPDGNRTWAAACDLGAEPHAAYDFHYNLAEAFGWELYRAALGRLFNFLQDPSKDAELQSLDKDDPNYVRNRFFLLFSQAAGRNLAPYFDRYGFGRGGHGITQSVKGKVAGLPVWTDNKPITSISNPGALTPRVGTMAAGTGIYRFQTADPDPGTVFTYSIVAGNSNNAFSIDPRTGILRVANPAYLRFLAVFRARLQLTVQVADNGVPQTTRTVSFNVQPLF